jgi:manganese transport protein
LIFSQVILSLQLSFAVFPLVQFTSNRARMGEFVNPLWLKTLAWMVAGIIAILNAYLLVLTVKSWAS